MNLVSGIIRLPSGWVFFDLHRPIGLLHSIYLGQPHSHLLGKELTSVVRLSCLALCVVFLVIPCHLGHGPGCSKLTMSLVNVSLNFQTFISNICQYFCWKNVRSFCSAKASLILSTKMSVCLVINHVNGHNILNELTP